MQRCTCICVRRFSTSAIAEKSFDLGRPAKPGTSVPLFRKKPPTLTSAPGAVRHREHRPAQLKNKQPVNRALPLKREAPLSRRDHAPATSRKPVAVKTEPEAAPAPSTSAFAALDEEPVVEEPSQANKGRLTRQAREKQLRLAKEEQAQLASKKSGSRTQPAAQTGKPKRAKKIKAVKNIEIPSVISVANLALLLKVKQCECFWYLIHLV
jgi:hypothetical protein